VLSGPRHIEAAVSRRVKWRPLESGTGNVIFLEIANAIFADFTDTSQ
jgi:hypothetical protein